MAQHPWRSLHYEKGRYFNPDTERQRFATFLKWIRNRRPGRWREHIPSTPGPRPSARVEGEALRVTFVNHSTFLLQTEGLNLLTDPVWSERVSPVSFAGPKRHRAPGIPFDQLPRVDAILLSHNHYDHCDTFTLKRLARRDRPAIFCPLGVSPLLRKLGFRDIHELDWWQQVPWRGVSAQCLPAQHFSARGPFDRNKTLWCGWAIRAAAGDIYFAGDTGFGRLFEEIAIELPRLRLALLPIGAFAPEWFMGPIHMTPEQALLAHSILRARTSIATHFGTFALADDGETEPLDRLREALIGSDARQAFLALHEGEAKDVAEFKSA